MKREQTIIKVPKQLIAKVNNYLSLPLGLDNSEYQGEDNTIIVATVKCSNGYEIDSLAEIIYFVEIAGTKETPKKSKVFVNGNDRSGFRWGHRIVWLDECLRTNW